jgi:hypothetical protein
VEKNIPKKWQLLLLLKSCPNKKNAHGQKFAKSGHPASKTHSTSVYLNGSAWQKQVLEVFAHSCTQSQTQGDQIGRIFAYWAIVFFGHFLKMTEWA